MSIKFRINRPCLFCEDGIVFTCILHGYNSTCPCSRELKCGDCSGTGRTSVVGGWSDLDDQEIDSVLRMVYDKSVVHNPSDEDVEIPKPPIPLESVMTYVKDWGIIEILQPTSKAKLIDLTTVRPGARKDTE